MCQQRIILSVLVPLFILAAGCSNYNVVVTPAVTRQPLHRGSPFRISYNSPPSDAVYIGTVSFHTEGSEVEDALNLLREKVRQVGGNFVADLKCQGVLTYRIEYSGWGTSSNLSSTKAYCKGRVYFAPYD